MNADAQVEAVLDILAPRAELPSGYDEGSVRVPVIWFECEGQAIMPSDEAVLDLARQIVTAVRTAR